MRIGSMIVMITILVVVMNFNVLGEVNGGEQGLIYPREGVKFDREGTFEVEAMGKVTSLLKDLFKGLLGVLFGFLAYKWRNKAIVVNILNKLYPLIMEAVFETEMNERAKFGEKLQTDEERLALVEAARFRFENNDKASDIVKDAIKVIGEDGLRGLEDMAIEKANQEIKRLKAKGIQKIGEEINRLLKKVF